MFHVMQAVEKMKRCFASPAAGGTSQATSDDDDVATGRVNVYDFDENTDRGNWAGRFDFVLSLLGSVYQGQIKVT